MIITLQQTIHTLGFYETSLLTTKEVQHRISMAMRMRMHMHLSAC